MQKLCRGLFCVWLVARPAWAEQRLVALVDADPQLEHAVSLALSPWNVPSQVIHEASPGTDLPGAARRAALLAHRLHASIIVWVSPSDSGSLLWIYETDRDEVSTRELAEGPPFSSPEAASVALSLKTLLRTTEVAPQAERFGAAPPRPEPHSPRLTFRALGDVRYFSRATTEVRAALSGVWWFPAPMRLGLGFCLGTGSGVAIRRGDFSGHFRQPSISAALAWQIAGNRLFGSSLYAGGSLHFSELSGFSESIGASSSTLRVVPSLDAGAELDLSLGNGFLVGTGVRALYLPRPERYLVKGETVFELWPIATEFGVRVGLNLL